MRTRARTAGPGRVGQVALVPRPLGFGRRAEGAPIAELACFAWQSPGEPLPPPSLGGLLSGESISRLQLRLTPTAVALEVVNEGQCEMLVNGKACRKAILRPGDDLMLKGEVALLCVRRPAVMPALRAARVAHARGEPDEVGIVGESPAAWKLRDDLTLAGQSSYHVLIHGETGTGKRSAAELVHLRSARARGPFVIRNVATFGGSQLHAAELFGNVKNFPSHGDPARPGLFGAARGGTGLLDEIGDCPLDVQAALLTALDEDKAVYTVLGTAEAVPVEARIVAATNRDRSVFRPDFYERFKVCVRVPPLRERPEDIPLIVRHLLRKAEKEELAAGKRDDPATARRLSGSFVDRLVRYAFPGNVRELEKILTAALAESPRGHIRAPESIDLGSPATAPASIPAARSRAELPSKEQVKETLEATGGNVKEAAQRLGVSRDALNRLIAKYWPRGPEGE